MQLSTVLRVREEGWKNGIAATAGSSTTLTFSSFFWEELVRKEADKVRHKATT
jgi:hypothetical protein